MRRLLLFVLFLSVSALAQPVQVRQFLLRLEPVRKDFNLKNLTDDERRVVGLHFAHLQRLKADGKLIVAGQAFEPNRGFWGILIVSAPDSESAAALMNADPAIKEKLVPGEVIPFRSVLFLPPDAPPAQ